MAQTTILSVSTGVATSSDVVLSAGTIATMGMFISTGNFLQSDYVTVTYKTPGQDTVVGYLTVSNPNLQLNGPGTFRATRSLSVTPIGVSSEV